MKIIIGVVIAFVLATSCRHRPKGVVYEAFTDTISNALVNGNYHQGKWNNLRDFSVVNGNADTLQGDIVVSAGATSTNLDLHWLTGIERYSLYTEFKIPEYSQGKANRFGIGTHSANTYISSSLYGYLGKTSSDSGKLYLLNSYPTDHIIDSSILSIAIKGGDKAFIRYERDGNLFRVSCFNITSGKDSINLAYAFSLQYSNSSENMPNTGRYSILSAGGNYMIDSISVIERELTSPDMLVIGDSKTVGSFAGKFKDRWVSKLANVRPKISVSAGGGDRTDEVLLKMNQIFSLRPKTVLIEIGSNDQDPVAFKRNYKEIVSRFEKASIPVSHLCFYCPGSEWRWEFLNTEFKRDRIINTFDPTKTNNALSNDNVHLSTFGNQVVFEVILQSLIINHKPKEI